MGITDRAQTGLFVQDRTQDGDGEVGKLRRSFIKLQPADDAVVGKVFGDAGLGDAQVLGKQRFQAGVAAAGGAGFGERTSITDG